MISEETAKETAKAVQEIAKATPSIAELADKVGAFVSKVVGKPAEQIGGIIEDQIRFYRYKNLCLIADKVQAINHKRTIEGKTIKLPPRIAIPLLQSAALEDDETLQEIWANLIANAMNPDATTIIHPSYVEVARQLSPDEALLLSTLAKEKKNQFLILSEKGTYSLADFRQSSYFKKTIVFKRPSLLAVYHDNLKRLGIIVYISLTKGHKLTTFGENFINACYETDGN